MSQSYFTMIPVEMYKKILFKLNPQSLINICETDVYAKNICNKKFFQEYIMKNYGPKILELPNWKSISKRLNEKKTLSSEIFNIIEDSEDSEDSEEYDEIDSFDQQEEIFIKDISFDIYFMDTGLTILERVNTLLQNEGIESYFYGIEFFFKTSTPLKGTSLTINTIINF